jgi:hypothetical protein
MIQYLNKTISFQKKKYSLQYVHQKRFSHPNDNKAIDEKFLNKNACQKKFSSIFQRKNRKYNINQKNQRQIGKKSISCKNFDSVLPQLKGKSTNISQKKIKSIRGKTRNFTNEPRKSKLEVNYGKSFLNQLSNGIY